MADREQIVQAILNAAGNPVSGVVVEQVGVWADAVVALSAPTETKAVKFKEQGWETRETKPDETR